MNKPPNRPQQRRMPIAAPLDMVQQRHDARGHQLARPEAPQQPKAKSDASYITVGLPSLFQWYPFKQLSVRPLRVPEVKKIHSAHITNDLRMFYEAMAPCLDQDVFELTVGDVYSVMFWLRINSYPKTPYTVRFKCTNPEHIGHTLTDPEPGETWTRLPMESLDNSHDVVNTMIEEIPMKSLDEIGPQLLATGLAQKGIAFAPTRVRDLVEVGEMANEDWFDEGDDFLCRLASYLDQRHGETLKERYDFIMNNPDIFTPDDVMELDQIAELFTHGVRETVKLNCKECSASNTVELPIDARTFLPYLYPN
jgi:hypothetical protein